MACFGNAIVLTRYVFILLRLCIVLCIVLCMCEMNWSDPLFLGGILSLTDFNPTLQYYSAVDVASCELTTLCDACYGASFVVGHCC
jgi:Kef-type K+ transport system membrane component KefB